jgi:hypothetical protein
MKICPVCRITYDNSQNFCLNDGSPLNFAAEPLQVEPLEQSTVVSSSPQTQPNPTNAQNRFGQQPPVAVIEKKSNIGKIIAITAVMTILFFGAASAAIYYFLTRAKTGNQNQPIVGNANQNKPKNSNVAAIAVNSNATNANAVALLPSPKPSINAEAAKTVQKEVNDVLENWKYSTMNGDLKEHLSCYADTVDYYKAGIVGVERVRADREKAFQLYPQIEVSLNNIKVTPDASGTKATVILDKSWRFENEENFSEGSVQQQLKLAKINNRWLITGEKDLKVYYKTKN